MAVWFKWIGIGLAVLVVLLAVTIAGALMLVDTTALKRVVSEQVEENTGRELTIEGELGISLFPWIGFELGQARLANAAGFDQRPFLALERVELRVRLLPLLAREVAVDRVVLHGLEVNLARDAGGRGNWEDLAANGEDAAAGADDPETTEPAATGDAEPAAATAFALRVEGLDIRDASLHWRDAGTGESVSVRDLDLETGVLEPGVPTPVRLRVNVESAAAPALAIDLQTEAVFEPQGPRLQLKGLTIELDASGDDLPGGELAARIGGDIDADLAADRVSIDPLELSLADTVTARGSVIIDIAGEQPTIDGNLEIAEFSPRELARALDAALPEGLDERALRSAAAGFTFTAGGDSARIDNLVVTLDDTRATGSLRAQTGDVPAASLQLAVDSIDLDRYLPPASGDGSAAADGEAPADGTGADPVASLPLDAMRGVRADAAVDIGRLQVRGLEATNAMLRARLDDGLFTLERLSADAAGGSLQIGARLDGRTDTPATGLDIRIDGIRAEPLLQALTGSVPVSGRLDAGIDLETAGGTLDEWIGALGGTIETTFSEGAVEGINIAQRIRVAWARLQGEQVEEAAAERRTDFSRLHFAGTVRDGVLRSDTLDLRAPLLRVGGSGEVDLARREIDYVARVRVTGTLEGQGGGSLEQVRGLDIPLRLRGPLTGPDIELAMGDALEAKAEARQEELKREAREAEESAQKEVDEAVEKEKRELERRKEREEQKAKEKLEKELKGLFD